MFSNEDLKCLDPAYFFIITTDAYEVTIMSRNTGHYWYLHNPEYPDQGTVIIFHKHKASHPYEQEFLPVKLLSFQGASPLLMWEV